MPQQNTVELEIVGTTHDGRGVARLDGLAVFVPYALEGERVRQSYCKKAGGVRRRPRYRAACVVARPH